MILRALNEHLAITLVVGRCIAIHKLGIGNILGVEKDILSYIPTNYVVKLSYSFLDVVVAGPVLSRPPDAGTAGSLFIGGLAPATESAQGVECLQEQ